MAPVVSKSGIAFRRFGAGRKIVLLHGIPGSGAVWDPTAVELAADYEVIVPDLLGFGSSARPDNFAGLQAKTQARAVAELLDEIGAHGVTLIGHDFGGPVALLLASGRPELAARLGLFAANTFTDTPVPFPLSTVTWPAVGGAAAKMLFSRLSLAMMLKTGQGKPRARLKAETYIGDAGQARSIRTIFKESLTRLEELYVPVESALKSLCVPSVVGWGDRDPFFSLEQGKETAKALGANLRVYPNAGHFLPEERPREVAATIRELVRTGLGARQ